jgi:hypothetical protein
MLSSEVIAPIAAYADGSVERRRCSAKRGVEAFNNASNSRCDATTPIYCLQE